MTCVPDAKWGGAITAFLVKSENPEVTDEALIAVVKARKGPVKAPKTVNFVAELPFTKVGRSTRKC